VHQKILAILKDAGRPLSNEEIAREALTKYSNIPEIAKWKDSSSAVGNIIRYVTIRRLQYLKSGDYIEFCKDGRWKFIMDEPLMNEVIRAYAHEKNISHKQAAKEILRQYIEKEKPYWKEYIVSNGEREKFEEESERRRKEILEKMKRAFPLTRKAREENV